jgi:hypothetical protein
MADSQNFSAIVLEFLVADCGLYRAYAKMGGHPSTSGYDSGYRAVGYPMMRILVSRMWLLLLCAMCASECAAKRHPVTGKLVGYRPTE